MGRILAAIAVLWLAPLASAEEPGKTILVASYVGNTEELLGPLLPIAGQTLRAFSVRWGRLLGTDIDKALGERPRTLTELQLGEIPESVKRLSVRLSMAQGQVSTHLRALQEIHHSLVAAQGTLALDAEIRGAYFSTLEVLAQSSLFEAKSKAKAIEYLSELARAFPGRGLSQDTQETLTKLHEKVVADLRGVPVDVVTVPARAIDWRVYANGSPIDGKTPSLKGDYAVFVATSRGDSRVHQVRVGDEAAPALRIDVPFDMAVRSDGLVGFRFDSTIQQEQMLAAYTGRLSSALGASTAFVLSFGSYKGKTGLLVMALLRSGERVDEFVPARSPSEVGEDRVRASVLSVLGAIERLRSKTKAKPEPSKAELAKQEPVKPITESVKATKPEPAKATKPEPTKPEPAKATKPEPTKPEPAKATKPEPTKPEPAKATKATNPEPVTRDLAGAEQAFFRDQHEVSIAIATELLRTATPDQRERLHWLIAASSCLSKDPKRIRAIDLRRLDSRGRRTVRSFCGRSGFSLASDDELGIKE